MADDEGKQQELGQLSVQRRQQKASVTRFINALTQHIAEEDVGLVRQGLEKLTASFRKLETIQIRYNEMITIEDVDDSDKYFYDVQSDYIQSLKTSKEWLRSQDRPNVNEYKQDVSVASADDTEVKSLKSEIAEIVNLPRLELVKFDGNPRMYHAFMATFDETVGSVNVNGKAKLTRLLQYTCGKAHDAIRSCILMEGDSGYERARSLLQQRFGNDYIVAEKLVNDLKYGKHVKQADEILALSDELMNCETTLSQMGHLHEVDNQCTILKIADRLPVFMQSRWKRKALEIKDEHDRYPKFTEFVKFVSKQAMEESDPVYGSRNKKQCDSCKPKEKSSSFTSRVRTDMKHVCPMCKGEHKLLYCAGFKSMKPAERLKFVTQKKLCENCLLSNHVTADCRKDTVCSVPGCQKRHTKFIHIDTTFTREQYGQNSGNQNDLKLVIANVNSGSNVHMPTVPVTVNGEHDVCALLDTASSQSFCTIALLNKLNLDGRPISFSMNTLNGLKEVTSKAVDLTVTSLDGVESLRMSNVYVVNEIPVKTSCPNFQSYSHFKGLQFLDSGQDVDLLIGQDNSEALIPIEVRRGDRGQPFACKTLFGWSVNGPGSRGHPVNFKVMSNFISSSVSDNVDKLWQIENDGLSCAELSMSQEDSKVLQLWDEECELIDGHYQLPIPWKNGVSVPNNIVVAKSRLKSLRANLDKRGLTERYNCEIETLVKKGYAEVIPNFEINNLGNVWYLPHHAVVSEKRPGKVRVVFDCASKFLGESLNDKCMQGPDLNNKLIHVLLRFREHEYCFMSDIEAMYYQVRLPPADRDAVRFLWFDSNDQIVHYRMCCHVFGGVWCASSSTYALRRTVADSPGVDRLVANTVMMDFYVDDCLKSMQNIDDAINVVDGTKELLQRGGFHLTKFTANNPGILAHLPRDEMAKKVKDLNLESDNKALGIAWDIDRDEFYFATNFGDLESITRRSMLSVLASFYDPLGLISPLIVRGKILFQDATRLRLDWNEVIPDELGSKWIQWLADLRQVCDLRIPRCIKPGHFDGSVIELHHFSDASERAYGSCSYIRCINKDGSIHTALLLSKCKVAPIKSISIPRLELQAAVLAVQLDELLRSQLSLDLTPSYFWVDSSIVLSYIRNERRRFQVYVGNRISLIRKQTEPDQWNHVPGMENPADCLTRGENLITLDKKKWLTGPEFLCTYKSEWKIPEVDCTLSESDPELRHDVHVNVVGNEKIQGADKLIEYYSDWYKLKRAVAWFLHLKDVLRNKNQISQFNDLGVADLKRAEIAIVQYVQRKSYGDEIRSLLKNKTVSKSSKIKTLLPVLDEDGLIRVGGRIANANLPYCSKHPCIIPHDHAVAKLIAKSFHDVAHVGTEWVVCLIREHFWITKIRSVVKGISRNCIRCKKLFAECSVQRMADLPLERVKPGGAPFMHTGMDCFGPFIVKRGRIEVKRHVVLFTCFAVRAVHLEKLDSLDTDSFLNALRRFIARRGQPLSLHSDNATNFVGGKRELSKSLSELDFNMINKFCVTNHIEWNFNPPCASHMGGVWERLIRTIRKVLSGLFGVNMPHKLSDEMLETVLCETESVVNSRPLTRLSDDVTDLTPLTPNHFLMTKQHYTIAPGSLRESDMFKRKWRGVQYMVDQFWKQWLRQYLPELQCRSKWLKKEKNFAEGDLVLICEENTPRGVWPIGVITSVNVSKDGLVRSVTVRTKASSFVRPITKLVSLECDNC